MGLIYLNQGQINNLKQMIAQFGEQIDNLEYLRITGGTLTGNLVISGNITNIYTGIYLSGDSMYIDPSGRISIYSSGNVTSNITGALDVEGENGFVIEGTSGSTGINIQLGSGQNIYLNRSGDLYLTNSSGVFNFTINNDNIWRTNNTTGNKFFKDYQINHARYSDFTGAMTGTSDSMLVNRIDSRDYSGGVYKITSYTDDLTQIDELWFSVSTGINNLVWNNIKENDNGIDYSIIQNGNFTDLYVDRTRYLNFDIHGTLMRFEK